MSKSSIEMDLRNLIKEEGSRLERLCPNKEDMKEATQTKKLENIKRTFVSVRFIDPELDTCKRIIWNEMCKV